MIETTLDGKFQFFIKYQFYLFQILLQSQGYQILNFHEEQFTYQQNNKENQKKIWKFEGVQEYLNKNKFEDLKIQFEKIKNSLKFKVNRQQFSILKFKLPFQCLYGFFNEEYKSLPQIKTINIPAEKLLKYLYIQDENSIDIMIYEISSQPVIDSLKRCLQNGSFIDQKILLISYYKPSDKSVMHVQNSNSEYMQYQLINKFDYENLSKKFDQIWDKLSKEEQPNPIEVEDQQQPIQKNNEDKHDDETDEQRDKSLVYKKIKSNN
ncbi:hypothetical protein ABPG72_017317 [Tetrahymena utriculariae]